MRTITLLPGMFGLNVALTFSLTKSGKDHSLKTVATDNTVTMWTKVTVIYDRWIQRQKLETLPDYMLKDLGLSREDVVREWQKPFWR